MTSAETIDNARRWLRYLMLSDKELDALEREGIFDTITGLDAIKAKKPPTFQEWRKL